MIYLRYDQTLILNQTLGFASIIILTISWCVLQPEKVAPISELGPDAYLELPSPEDLIASFKTRKGSIKALLLDQVLHSTGNISWNSVWHFKLWETL